MNIDRRSLMKGMLAGGALLALGIPPWGFASSAVRRPHHCVLLLGGTGADDQFERGAGAACAGMTYEGLQILRLKDRLLAGTDGIVQALEQSRGSRWIVVMDDASAVIFLELARAAGARLLSMGTHACSTESSCQLRHTFAAASPAYSIGGLLASDFIKRSESFSITERVLQSSPEERALTSWSAPGFSSYRSGDKDAIHLHCSGCSLPDGCRLLGLEAIEGWISIPSQVGTNESVTWQAFDWAESVGYGVTASALGVRPVQESCSGRAFVHRSRMGERMQPTERFVSLVIDL